MKLKMRLVDRFQGKTFFPKLSELITLSHYPYYYEVVGLPAGEKAWISGTDLGNWVILRAKDGVSGEWIGAYETRNDALEALQKEVDIETSV